MLIELDCSEKAASSTSDSNPNLNLIPDQSKRQAAAKLSNVRKPSRLPLSISNSSRSSTFKGRNIYKTASVLLLFW